jgi:nucleoside-diphosphate-sugar epimerase
VNIVVTGGAGYIGSVLVPMLLAKGHRVRVFDKLRFGGHGLLPACAASRFELVPGDIGDDAAVGAALSDADAIIHLAAVVGYVACLQDPRLAVSTNFDGTKTVLAHRKPDQRFVFASTGSVYGSADGGLCTEESFVDPGSLYGRTKADAESIVLDAGNCVSLRFATAFGASPCMRFDLLPNDFTYQAVNRGSLVVYEGHFRRTFIHVRDIARSLCFVLDNWDSVVDDMYNIGSERMNMTKREVAEKIRQQVDYYLHFAEFDTDADRRNHEFSYEKIRSKGFDVEIDMDEGVAELVRAARLVAAGAR